MKNIIMKHWTEGGTGVTNFQPDRLPIFREAVRRYGDPTLIVLDEAMPPAPKNYGGSLHCVAMRWSGMLDLSPFWCVYEEVANEGKGRNAHDAYDRAMGIVKK
jgi:hypothetical protein